jgi:hypothetical protein
MAGSLSLYKAQAHETIDTLLHTCTYESKRMVLYEVIELLKEKSLASDDVIQAIEQFRDAISFQRSDQSSGNAVEFGDQKKRKKAKRPPNSYNLFMSDKMKELKNTQPELNNKELMRLALESYKSARQEEAAATSGKNAGEGEEASTAVLGDE